MIYNVGQILNDILYHIDNKIPFSLVRLGDGDLKLLKSLLLGRANTIKFDRSGIPYDKVGWLLNIYRTSCNNANYTSSFEVYDSTSFWNRSFSMGTSRLVDDWENTYKKIGITNKNFCNPEIGHLLFLEHLNFLMKIKNKRICLITCFEPIIHRFKEKNYNANIILIPSIGNGHFNRHVGVIRKIKRRSNNTDLFLVGAGALGKRYLNIIKDSGSVAIDIGQVMNVWAGRGIPTRLKRILRYDENNMTFKLAKRFEKYRKHL